MHLIDLDPLAAAELGSARTGAGRPDPTPRVRRGDGVGPLPVDRMRGALDDLRHMRRHAVLAADQASRAGVEDVANYHLGRASALLDTLDRMEHALR
jgi:hypothetical protein